MTRILVRAHKHPLAVASAAETLEQRLIGSNVGNLVFSQAVFRLLSTNTNTLTTSKLIGERAERINAEFDHLVLPMANTFRITFLQRDALSALVERLTIPVTVIGVGAQAGLTGTYRHAAEITPSVKRFCRAVLDHSPTIGVRGEFTRRYLKSLGFGDEHVDVIGCPSMFMFGPELPVQRRSDELGPGSPIALNVSPYVKAMGPISLDHAARYPNLVYFAQDENTLRLLLWGRYTNDKAEAQRAAGAPVSLDHPLIRHNRVRFCVDPRTWMEELRAFDFSFGSRIHGNITALLAGTPALVLAHDSRTLELAEYHQIPYRSLDLSTGAVDAAALYAQASWQPMLDGHADRWEVLARFLDRHGLSHVYANGINADDFDAALAAATYPPAVQTLMGASPEELYAMKREVHHLRRRHDARRGHPWPALVHRLRAAPGRVKSAMGRLGARRRALPIPNDASDTAGYTTSASAPEAAAPRSAADR